MKKYHMMRVYQTTKCKGYISYGEKHSQMIVLKNRKEKYKLEAAYTIMDTNIVIIVERISKYLVREVKTGIILPIVNIKKKDTANGPVEYLYGGFKKVHTFVCAKEGTLLSKEVNTSRDLEEYNKLYPNTEVLKEELIEIILSGKDKMDNKLYEEEEEEKQEHQIKKDTKIAKKNERKKVRRLKREFRQSRKSN